jgi:ATP-GRASP peptide maturase of grasp-with-spasm system
VLPNDKIYIRKIDFEDDFFILEIENKIFNSKDIQSVWFRRGKLNTFINEIIDQDEISKKLRTFNYGEKFAIEAFVHSFFLKKISVNNSLLQNVNKPIVLSRAKSNGLQIPETIITSCKDELINFKKEHQRIITKSTNETLFFTIQDIRSTGYTIEVTNQMISEIPDVFTPSLFQKRIEKEFEIRTFFLNESFYSMAIFSQSNTKTKLDFRHYDDLNPNRNIPFLLPPSIEERTKKLMSSMKLNCGSLDFICDVNGDIIFLEINPVGQFGMLSAPCNYYLEKEIANALIP